MSFHSNPVGSPLLPRQCENNTAHLSEMGLGGWVLGDGIGWVICFLRVFRDAIESVLGCSC